LSNHILGVLKTFGMLPGVIRGLRFDRRVETLVADRADIAPIVRPGGNSASRFPPLIKRCGRW
jgi:transposase